MKLSKKLIALPIAVCAAALLLVPSFAGASDSDILKRLEQMEKEIKQLKKENSELRGMVDKDRQEKASVSELKQMVETDRKEIEELKASAGLASKGLRAVMGKYDMQIYGRVKVDLQYDTADFRNYNDFLGAVGIGSNENDSTNFNPRDTRFGLKVARRDNEWLSEARIEMDFYGTNAGNNLIPRMRLGYVKITNDNWKASLLVGQDWIPIASLNPSTIDFGVMAAAGNLWWRVPQVTLRKQVGDNFELLLSAMRHRRISTAEGTRPWGIAKLSYKNGILGKGGLLALGFGFNNSEVRNNFNKKKDVDRWLLALELKLVFGKFTLKAEPWIGEGLDREFLRYDMGVNPYDNSLSTIHRDPDTIRSRGGFVSLTYKASPKLNFSLGYGVDDPNKSDMKNMKGFLNNRQFTKNEMYFFNSWYSVTSAVKMGVEVMYLETERFSDSDNGMRFTFSTAYMF